MDFNLSTRARTRSHTSSCSFIFITADLLLKEKKKLLLRKWASDLWQISEVAGQSEVKFLRVVVSDDPGEDRVLVQVIVGPTWREKRKKWNRRCLRGQDWDLIHVVDVPTSDGVDEDEVFKVGYLPPLPALGHVGGFEKLLWCRQRDSSKRQRGRNGIN